ncbi:(2,3-dihydroxybenzoyl)adenylate synthase [Actinoplanes sp. L3-i22]|uniref:(2,3-dihydroxybenzoyl)adenylate synthase n=1 Tax=Actinoplanes sp. L3-i22 TaxID=2836373 RepID=UPI002107036C|nr:AMP-binding protein [Actinoplanes sp. L3-i22]
MSLDGVVPFPDDFARRYRAAGYWAGRPLGDVLDEACRRHRDRVALHSGGVDVTYAELERRAARLAANLTAVGLRPGDRVVVQLPNVAEFAYLHLALQKIAVIPVMALPVHRFREVAQFVALSGAVACFVPDRYRDFDFREMTARIPGLRWTIVLGEPGPAGIDLRELIARPPFGAVNPVRPDPAGPALFLLSGGTTGVPKLIPRTHDDYVYNTRMAASVCDIRPDDCLLNVLPIEHNLPLGCPGLQGFLLAGARTVLHPSTRAREVFELIERHRVTHIHLVPALLIRWLHDPALSEFDLSSVRVVQSGGQRLQPETRLLAERLLPNCTVQENFGMAEGLLMFVRLDDPADVRLATVGRPVCPDDEVRLVDEAGHDVPAGEVGELLARGPYTLRGYFRAPEHNARAFTPDGFYRSGDLMRRHPSGNYVVEGRVKDLINRGGEKISAEEVENLLLGHPAVRNVACVPVPDELLGERMCACVQLRPGVPAPTLAELVAFLRAAEIASFKLPERLAFFDELPLSPIGKISKKALVDQLVAA